MSRKVVLITGASSGVGAALVLEFARRRYRVWATSRSVYKFSKVRKICKKEKLDVVFLKIDLSSQTSIERGVKKMLIKDRKIDILINNAGYGLVGAVEETPIDELRGVFEANFFGLFRLTQLILPIMRKRRTGTIVNIGAIEGRFSKTGIGGYSASKHALKAVSESLFLEMEKFGVRVVLLELGGVKTRFRKKAVQVWQGLSKSSYKQVYLDYQKRSKFDRFRLKPSKVAELVVDLCEEESPMFRQVVGVDARIYIFLKSILPGQIFLKILRSW